MYSGAIGSQWSQVDAAVNSIVYSMLAAYDVDRPNSQPIAEAVLSTHRSFQGKANLAANLCAVVLVRQPLLKKSIFEWLKKAKFVADHRNSVLHGYLIHHSSQDGEKGADKGLFISEPFGFNSFKAFTKDIDNPIDFSKARPRRYNKDALVMVFEAVNEVHKNLIHFTFDPYMNGLANGSIKPSQAGNLRDKTSEPHDPLTSTNKP